MTFMYSFNAVALSQLFELFFLRQSFQYSTNLSTNFFLHFQFPQSKYSPTSHDLSHSNSLLLGFQIALKSHTPLLIKSLHSRLHLSSFQHYLLLQTVASNLHLHLHISTNFICLVSLIVDIRLNTLTFKFLATSGTRNFAYGLLILLLLPVHLPVLILKGQSTGSSLLRLTFCGLTLHY